MTIRTAHSRGRRSWAWATSGLVTGPKKALRYSPRNPAAPTTRPFDDRPGPLPAAQPDPPTAPAQPAARGRGVLVAWLIAGAVIAALVIALVVLLRDRGAGRVPAGAQIVVQAAAARPRGP